MKTTIEIPDSLLEEARKLASQEGTTVRALVETGLRQVLSERKKRGRFKLGRHLSRALDSNPASPTLPGSELERCPTSTTLEQGKLSGLQVHDARVAALCLHHGVSELWTVDRHFGRFPNLTVRNPLVG